MALIILVSWMTCCAGKSDAKDEEGMARPSVLQADIGRDGRSVVITGHDGNVLHTVDVIAACGVPAIGEQVVRDVHVVGGSRVDVVYGKHSFATIDGATGKVECTGGD